MKLLGKLEIRRSDRKLKLIYCGISYFREFSKELSAVSDGNVVMQCRKIKLTANDGRT